MPLLEALHNPALTVRAKAVRQLGKLDEAINDKSLFAVVLKAVSAVLGDPQSVVRQEAAETLGELGDPSAAGTLINALDDSSPEVRSTAAWALGRLGAVEAVPALTRTLRDENHYVRHSTATALGKLADQRAQPALLEVLHDSNDWVRSAAAQALGTLGDATALPVLERLARQVTANDSISTFITSEVAQQAIDQIKIRLATPLQTL